MTSEQKKQLGQRIVQIRKKKRWKQTELAAELGVPRERVGKWERGIAAPSVVELAALSAMLEVPMEELGLGKAREELLTHAQARELILHLKAMARVLRPYMERAKGT
ncbi:MAG TPA: helix-turn-helix transcriptional regulator [Thermoanaerobaculia bacterium]|nr:helix-turn-helix transcriptional regulator [Thermoanaerobaculia bacterium]